MSRPCPCKDCVPPKRWAGCHSCCKEYIEWDAEHQKDLAEIREKTRARNDCFPTYKQQCDKMKNRKRRAKYGHHSTD